MLLNYKNIGIFCDNLSICLIRQRSLDVVIRDETLYRQTLLRRCRQNIPCNNQHQHQHLVTIFSPLKQGKGFVDVYYLLLLKYVFGKTLKITKLSKQLINAIFEIWTRFSKEIWTPVPFDKMNMNVFCFFVFFLYFPSGIQELKLRTNRNSFFSIPCVSQQSLIEFLCIWRLSAWLWNILHLFILSEKTLSDTVKHPSWKYLDKSKKKLFHELEHQVIKYKIFSNKADLFCM